MQKIILFFPFLLCSVFLFCLPAEAIDVRPKSRPMKDNLHDFFPERDVAYGTLPQVFYLFASSKAMWFIDVRSRQGELLPKRITLPVYLGYLVVDKSGFRFVDKSTGLGERISRKVGEANSKAEPLCIPFVPPYFCSWGGPSPYPWAAEITDHSVVDAVYVTSGLLPDDTFVPEFAETYTLDPRNEEQRHAAPENVKKATVLNRPLVMEAPAIFLMPKCP